MLCNASLQFSLGGKKGHAAENVVNSKKTVNKI